MPVQLRLLSSLLLCGGLLFAGCEQGGDTRTFTDTDDVTHDDDHGHHHHGEHGPHGGHIIELGGEDYHAELTMDAGNRTLTAYLLEADMETPLPVDAESLSVRLQIGEETQELKLSPQPQEGDGEGQASQFAMTDATLPESIRDEEDLQGEVVVSFGGTQYRGKITHDHDHGHEGHDHEGHDHDKEGHNH